MRCAPCCASTTIPNQEDKEIARNYRVNHRIRSPEVRLVREGSGEGTGVADVMTRQAALNLANESGLDLVEVGPNQSPPVVRLMDYGKFKFDQSKRAKEARKASRSTGQLKKVQLTTKIAPNDMDMKTKKVLGFLRDGAKVQVFVKFRGRERAHPELGMEVLRKIAFGVAESARLEQKPKMEGRNLSMLLAPRSKSGAPKRPSDDPSGNGSANGDGLTSQSVRDGEEVARAA